MIAATAWHAQQQRRSFCTCCKVHAIPLPHCCAALLCSSLPASLPRDALVDVALTPRVHYTAWEGPSGSCHAIHSQGLNPCSCCCAHLPALPSPIWRTKSDLGGWRDTHRASLVAAVCCVSCCDRRPTRCANWSTRPDSLSTPGPSMCACCFTVWGLVCGNPTQPDCLKFRGLDT